MRQIGLPWKLQEKERKWLLPLKKLSIDTLSNLTPHRLKVFFYYSHPPVLARIQAIEYIKK